LFNAFHEYLSNHDILPVVPQDFSPGTNEPQVLDCGYGTGIWIEDLMDPDAYPDSVVSEQSVNQASSDSSYGDWSL
jgi:hypothetical protein